VIKNEEKRGFQIIKFGKEIKEETQESLIELWEEIDRI